MKNALRAVLLGSVAATSFAVPAIASAQEQVAVDEIVVTGSRIRRDTFIAPVTLATIDSEQIVASGSVSLGDMLMDLPMINAASNSQNTSSTLFLAGLSLGGFKIKE